MDEDLRQKLTDRYPDTDILLLDDFDQAIIGLDEKTLRVIYSKKKILEILQEEQGMNETEALEYYEFNILGAHLGEKTPIFLEQPPQ